MWRCEESLTEAGIGPKTAVRRFADAYTAYVTAYHHDASVCGREKLILSQSAYYLDSVIGIRIEGIVVTLSLGNKTSIVIPRSQFYE